MLTLFGTVPFVLFAEDRPNLTGDFRGTIGPLRQKLHLAMKADGSLSGSIDSLDQGAIGIPCSDFNYDGKTLSFLIPSIAGSWTGSVSNDGTVLDGTLNETPLRFSRDTLVIGRKPSHVDGIWLGSVHDSGRELRAQLILKSDASGREYGTFDSVDELVYELECANIVLSNDDFSFEVPSLRSRWSGKLSADGNTLSGAWLQSENSHNLVFTRQTTPFRPPPPPSLTYQAATPPVEVAHLKMVLDEDFAKAQKDGILAPKTGIGVSIGVIKSGKRNVFAFGSANADSIFEIGSITKTFTGLILAKMVEQGKVKYDEPARELLPAGTVPKPSSSEITLVDLATQHSGLPSMLDNLPLGDPTHPYAHYTDEDLYAFLKKRGLGKPNDPPFLYSNLGFALLGRALAERAGLSYSELLKKEVTEPLGLDDTVVTLSPEQLSRFVVGHGRDRYEVHALDLDAMVGAGEIRSTAGDLLSYLEAQLDPGKVAAKNGFDETLTTALLSSHLLRAGTDRPTYRIALAWLFATDSQTYSHGGQTAGYGGFVLFNPKGNYGVAVLTNVAKGFAELVAEHIVQRLEGKPAIYLLF